jgi:hypothetical protein
MWGRPWRGGGRDKIAGAVESFGQRGQVAGVFFRLAHSLRATNNDRKLFKLDPKADTMFAWILIFLSWVTLFLLILHDVTKNDCNGSAVSIAAKKLWRHKFASLVIALLALAYLSPLWFDRNDLRRYSQHWHCKDKSSHDRKDTPRPTSSLKIIRLTRLGEFVDRCELSDVLYELNWGRHLPLGVRGATFDLATPKLPKLAVLYIHGWKHDASDEDEDRKSFDNLIKSLQAEYKDRKYVVGIYVGWDAASQFPKWLDFLENFSFWAKEQDADRIARSGVVTRIVGSIASIIRSAPPPDNPDEFIAIGHSFGARMLYSATAQTLISQTESAHPGYNRGTYRRVAGVTDAVILLNPAFEAARYRALDDFARSGEAFSRKQKPLMIVISSDGDFATKKLFPLGQIVSLELTKQERTTLGNYESFRTHRLRPTEGNCGDLQKETLTDGFERAGFCLEREKERHVEAQGASRKPQRFNPFIVASTPTSVIKDHGDIWNCRFKKWLFELIKALDQPKNRAMNLDTRTPASEIFP